MFLYYCFECLNEIVAVTLTHELQSFVLYFAWEGKGWGEGSIVFFIYRGSTHNQVRPVLGIPI